jgi:spoIIIJ-associated protein
MNARDRRVIHLALRDEAGVETFSEGEGAFRRVVISPAP